jgi:hypothetical protein
MTMMPRFAIREHHARTHLLDFRLMKACLFRMRTVQKGILDGSKLDRLAMQSKDEEVTSPDLGDHRVPRRLWLKVYEWRQDAENEPVGLILCTSNNWQHVKLLLSSGPHKMQVSENLTQLPSKHLRAERLKMCSRLLERESSLKVMHRRTSPTPFLIWLLEMPKHTWITTSSN